MEENFISMSADGSLIITHRIKGNMDEILQKDDVKKVVHEEVCPSESPVERDLFFTSACDKYLEKAIIYKIK